MINAHNALICITGPESSGKSTLAAFLSRELGLELVDEYAREFLEQRSGQYTQADLDLIAHEHLTRVRLALRDQVKPVLTDTFFLVLKIWSQVKYGEVSQFIAESYQTFKPAFYLLCQPDLAWSYDPLRESKESREALFEMYLSEIVHSKTPYAIVSGTGEERSQKALLALEGFLQKSIP